MFIRVKEVECGDELILNTDNIAYIHQIANIVCLNGTHGEGNGLIYLTNESMERLVKAIHF